MIMTKVNPPPSLSVWPASWQLAVLSSRGIVVPVCRNFSIWGILFSFWGKVEDFFVEKAGESPRLQELLNLRKSLFWIWRKVEEFFCRKSWGKVAPVCMNFSIWVLASEICIYIGEKAISCYLLAVQTSSIGDLATAQSLRVFTFTFDRPLRHFVSQNSWKQQFTKR